MHVVIVEEFGGPEVLEVVDQPTPAPGAGEALVEVAYAPALFLDTQMRAGRAQDWFPTRPPYVPGAGVAGTVAAVGDGVDAAWVGRRVVADTPDHGGYAEQAVIKADSLIAVPEGVGLDEAAALMHDGRTALKLIDTTRPESGEWVLVLGAAGGLGALLVQLARAAGAHVIGAVGDHARKLALVRDFGATAVDYDRPDWAETVRSFTHGAGVDVILDGIGGSLGTAAFALAAPGARVCAYGTPGGGFAQIGHDEAAVRKVTLTGIEQVQLAPDEARQLVQGALTEAAAGSLRPIIGQTFALDHARDAHRAIESRTVIGKTLLEA
jgi:NADPH2:quinone reductase